MARAYISVVRGSRHKGSSCGIVPLVFPARRGQHVPRVSEKPTTHTVSLSLVLTLHSDHTALQRDTQGTFDHHNRREREKEREGEKQICVDRQTATGNKNRESEKTERGVKRRGSRVVKAGDGQTDTDRYTARG